MGRRLPRRRCPRRRCDGPTSTSPAWARRLRPGPAGPMAERWLSLSWWWACESRRGRSRRGSGRCSGISVVRGRLRGLSWGNRPHFGADQPRRSMRWADVYVCMLADGVALRNRCMEMMQAAVDIIGGGVLARFPALRVGFLEGNCPWVPFLLWRLDEHYEWRREWDAPNFTM